MKPKDRMHPDFVVSFENIYYYYVENYNIAAAALFVPTVFKIMAAPFDTYVQHH